jgi:small-conductance mechanosensitive channel
LLVLLEAVTVSIDRVCKDPAPQALLIKFGPDGLELEIGFWIIDPENGQLNLLSEVNRAIWKLLREQKVTVPYPQREVRFINEKVVTVSTVAVPEVAAAA